MYICNMKKLLIVLAILSLIACEKPTPSVNNYSTPNPSYYFDYAFNSIPTNGNKYNASIFKYPNGVYELHLTGESDSKTKSYIRFEIPNFSINNKTYSIGLNKENNKVWWDTSSTVTIRYTNDINPNGQNGSIQIQLDTSIKSIKGVFKTVVYDRFLDSVTLDGEFDLGYALYQ